MDLHARGDELLGRLKAHVLEILATLPESGPAGPGLGNAEIERRAADSGGPWRTGTEGEVPFAG